MKVQQTVLNPTDIAFYDNAYHIVIGYHCSINYVVIADSGQDAIDIIIDHLSENESDHPGYFLSESEVQKIENDTNNNIDHYIYGGNHCRYLSFTNEELYINDIGKTDNLKFIVEYEDQ